MPWTPETETNETLINLLRVSRGLRAVQYDLRRTAAEGDLKKVQTMINRYENKMTKILKELDRRHDEDVLVYGFDAIHPLDQYP